MSSAQSRDYSIIGPERQHAIDSGLAAAGWYKPKISRKKLKELMRRSDGPATRDTLIWLALLATTGAAGVYFWGSWFALPFFTIYGLLYGSAGDSRWHECSHGTAFETRWKNEGVYQIASFMMMRNPVTWRWSHTRHHTDTIIVGLDPEIVAQRPPNVAKLILNLFGLIDVPVAITTMLRHASGSLSREEKEYVPETERLRAYNSARVWLAIYTAVVYACFALGSILPAMLIGLPRIYGTWHHLICGISQHVGLAEDTLDHRLNSRTIYMNQFSRFLYWNMNYHIEHHIFPMVPYHALPMLHEELRDQLPKPYNGFVEAYREIVPTMKRQLRDPSYFVRRELPHARAGATACMAPKAV